MAVVFHEELVLHKLGLKLQLSLLDMVCRLAPLKDLATLSPQRKGSQIIEVGAKADAKVKVFHSSLCALDHLGILL
jgi:hypothetical protein